MVKREYITYKLIPDVNIKNNQTGTQETIPVGFIIDYIIQDQQRNHQHGGGCCGGHGHDEDHGCCGGHGHDDDHECCGGNGHGCGCQH